MIKAVTVNIIPKITQQFGSSVPKKECKNLKNADEAISAIVSKLKNAQGCERCDVNPCIHFDNQQYVQFENIIKIVPDEVSNNPCLKRLVVRVQLKDSGEGKEVMIGQLRGATGKTIIEFLQNNKGGDIVKHEFGRLAENILKD